MGVLIYGSTNIEVAHNTISHTWGDGVSAQRSHARPLIWVPTTR